VNSLDDLFQDLITTLSDPSEEVLFWFFIIIIHSFNHSVILRWLIIVVLLIYWKVVRMNLQVLSKLSSDESYFNKLMHKVLYVFNNDRKLLESRGNLIIRQLSLYIKAEKIYRTLAKILENAEVRNIVLACFSSSNKTIICLTVL
jgi:hypothetical protein